MRHFTVPLAAAALLLSGCSASLPQGSDKVEIDPEDFTTEITNRWWPMKPNTQHTFRATEDGEESIVILTYTDKTMTLKNGVEVRLVRDTVYEEGELHEDTFDYFAQHKDGTVWYFGEEAGYYEDGKFKEDAGSFEAGVNGAEAGVAMPADPQDGDKFRLEYAKDQAEDNIEIIDRGTFAETLFDYYPDVVVTADTSALERKVLEHKFYADGVGPVLSLDISDGASREELISVKKVAPGTATGPLGDPDPLP